MNNSSISDFKDYFGTAKKYHDQNEDYLNHIKNAYNNGYEFEPDKDIVDSQNALAAELSRFVEHKIGLVGNKEVLTDKDIGSHFADLDQMISKLEQFKSHLLDHNRSFKDLVIEGPENMAEVALLECATMCLDPHELAGAVRDDLPISSVMGKIEDSKRMKQNRQFLMQHQEQMIVMQAEKTVQQETMTKEIKSLGQEFGVLDEITKSISHADRVKPPENSPENPKKSLGIDI
jgi:hypothetical protein